VRHVGFEKHKGLGHNEDIRGGLFKPDLEGRSVVVGANQAFQLPLKRAVVLPHSPKHVAAVLR
jgi:hypothetical protein